MISADPYRPDPRITDLGTEFYDEVEAAPFPALASRYRNDRWAARIGLDSLTDDAWRRHFGAFEPLPRNLQKPLAQRYHGHQFRSYNPDLGDGRGFLFAQLRDAKDGRLLDLGTKGSGQTPWSRGGDGRLTLKGGVREILATALLEALGVNTSKSFSLIETGEELERNDEPSPTRSSVLVRLSHSHLRFGTFQRLAAHERTDLLLALVDYAVTHYETDLLAWEGPERVIRWFERVVLRSADLAASWMLAGFVHGVLNTDNMNLTGESFDYGPYRFLPRVDPHFTAAYFDQTGLYAYGRQPEAVAWNLTRLAETLLPLCDKEPLEDALRAYGPAFDRAFGAHTVRRLGLQNRPGQHGAEADAALANDVHRLMFESQVDFESFFFDWYGGPGSDHARQRLAAGPYDEAPFRELEAELAPLEPLPHIDWSAPYFDRETPCTLLIDEIEGLWSAIEADDDWAPLRTRLDEIEQMRQALAPPADASP